MPELGDNITKTLPKEEQGLEKKLTAFDLFTIGFGAIIGVGWVIVVGDWVNLGGGPLATTLAFLAGAAVLLPISMVFGELSVAIPVAGGAIVYTQRAFGRGASFLTGWFLTLAYVMLCPWEVIAIGQLAETLIPAMRNIPLYTIGGYTIYLPTLIVCLLVACFVFYANHRGLDHITKVQNSLVVLLLGISIFIIMAALVFGNVENMFPLSVATEMNPSGSFWTGFFSVLAMTPFFYSGFDTVGQGAEEVKEEANKRQVGRISYISVISSAIFYALIIPAVCMVIPWREMLRLNLPAAEVFSVGLGFGPVKTVVIIGAFCGLMTTLNSFFIAGARVLLSMGRTGMIPQGFSKLHPVRSTPYLANIAIGLLSVAGAFLGKSLLLPIINVGSLGFTFAWLMVGLSALKIKKATPNLHRPFRVSAGLNLLAVILSGAVLLLLLIPASPGALKWPLEIGIVLIWLLIGALFYLLSQHGKDRR